MRMEYRDLYRYADQLTSLELTSAARRFEVSLEFAPMRPAKSSSLRLRNMELIQAQQDK